MSNEKIKWFTEARFGMFIHYGLYSMLGRGEWLMYLERMPLDEYKRLTELFNPDKDCVENWVKLAKQAGMKYMVLTSKHHDGFALFDSKVSDFTSVKSKAKRDLIREYVEACRRHDIKTGIYYSLPDWSWQVFYDGPESNPAGWDEFIDYIHAQVEEICSNYGKIDILWYDKMMPRTQKEFYKAEHWKAEKLNSMVRKLQPDIIINDRSGLEEDFDTPEQRIAPPDPARPWEACMTMNCHWGYTADDDQWKSSRELVKFLTAVSSYGGNYLLNIGPKADGSVPEESIDSLKQIAQWIDTNGTSIFGHVDKSFKLDGGTFGTALAKEGKVYLFVHFWPVGAWELVLPEVDFKIEKAYFLQSGEEIKFTYDQTRLILKGLPDKSPDPLCSVIVLEKA